MGLFEGQVARFPDRYPWTQQKIKAIQNGLWTESEFTFQSDKHQFRTQMTEEEQQVIVRALSAIGQIEIAVKTFWAKIGDWFPHNSISDLGYVLSYTEVVHGMAYTKLLEVLNFEHIFEENLKVPVIKKRVEYLKKHTQIKFEDDRKQKIYALILFTLFIENVSLFSQFYTVLFFDKSKNLLKDVANQIAYTIKEEELHADVGITLINTLRVEYPELFDDEMNEIVAKEVKDAYRHECKVMEWILGEYNATFTDSSGTAVLNTDVLKYFIAERINESMKEINMPFSITPRQKFDGEIKWFNDKYKLVKKTDSFAKTSTAYDKHARDYDNEEL